MVEDKRFLSVIQDMARDIEAGLVAYNRSVNGNNGRERIELHLRYLDALSDTISQQRRAIDFMQGKPVAPQTHFGEGVLIAVGGHGG